MTERSRLARIKLANMLRQHHHDGDDGDDDDGDDGDDDDGDGNDDD